MAFWLQDMYIWLGLSPKAAKLLIRKQGLNSPERLRVLTDKNVDGICIVMRKPGGKNTNGMPDRGQQVSIIAQKYLKLALFLFHHRWRCTLDWEIMGVHEDTVCLLAEQKKLNNEYKDPDVLPKINKSYMTGTMKAIEEYLRSHQDVIRALMAYIIRKTILVQSYGDYPKYVASDNGMISRMLHLPPDKNELILEWDAQSARASIAEYKRDNKSVRHFVSDLQGYWSVSMCVKQHKSKWDGRGAFYAIHSRWLDPNHVNMTASEAEMT